MEGVMAEVFLSYAKADRALAQQLADLLRAHGIDVWWDFDLVGGEQFRKAIQAELDKAKAAIVIWTERSIGSPWVCDESGPRHEREQTRGPQNRPARVPRHPTRL